MDQISIGTDLDRISDLPGNVIDQILAFLPFKDAVRTSTLSKQSEDRWHMLPHIIIDEEMYKKRNGLRFESVINYILNRHEGRINKFSVLVDVKHSYNVKWWICTLERKGVEELFLRYHWRSKGNEVPSILFSCQQLRKLILHDCVVLKPAPRGLSRGFPRLISLELSKVNIEIAVFEEIISSSPLLEQLTLTKLRFVDGHLHINVPKLKSFSFEGELVSVCFNTPLLEILSINVYICRLDGCYYYDRDFWSDLGFKILGLPSRIEELYLRCEFEKYLAACDDTLTTYSHLRTLKLDRFCFDNVEQVLGLLSLIGSSFNLTTLDITAYGCRSNEVSKPLAKIWEEQNNALLILNYLKKMRVTSFYSINDPEIKFIKYVMTNSPALEEMTVEYTDKNSMFNIDEVKRVLQLLCKTSTKLSFIAANHDQSSSKDNDFGSYGYNSNRDYVEDSD